MIGFRRKRAIPDPPCRFCADFDLLMQAGTCSRCGADGAPNCVGDSRPRFRRWSYLCDSCMTEWSEWFYGRPTRWEDPPDWGWLFAAKKTVAPSDAHAEKAAEVPS